jgi:hypothetical protein
MADDLRPERLAISLTDVDRLPPELKRGFLAGRIDATKIIRVGAQRRTEEQPAVEFVCPLLEAATVCDMIRSHDRSVGDRPCEVFISRGTINDTGRECWTRVIYATTFTVLINGKVSLNPELFTVVTKAVPQSEQVRAVKPVVFKSP